MSMVQNRDNKILGWESPQRIHPGEHLEDFLLDSGITQTELAERIGLSKKAVNEIVNGKNPITQNTAFGLSKVFSISPEFWINLQNSYDLAVAREEEESRLGQEVEEYLPAFKETYQELGKKAFVPGLAWTKNNLQSIAQNLQRYFGVDSLGYVSGGTMKFAFRKYHRKNVNHHTLAAWVQLGKLQAKFIETEPYSKERLREILPEIKELTRKPWYVYIPALEKKLASCGVILILAPRLKCAPVQGATHWIESDKVLVMLNADNQYEDRFWFSLFHELGHVLLHGKKDVYVDFDQDGEKTPDEHEADEFAQKWLIPNIRDFYSTPINGNLDGAVKAFAEKNGVSPAIVAGRLTYELGANRKVYSLMSRFLKDRIQYSNVRSELVGVTDEVG